MCHRVKLYVPEYKGWVTGVRYQQLIDGCFVSPAVRRMLVTYRFSCGWLVSDSHCQPHDLELIVFSESRSMLLAVRDGWVPPGLYAYTGEVLGRPLEDRYYVAAKPEWLSWASAGMWSACHLLCSKTEEELDALLVEYERGLAEAWDFRWEISGFNPGSYGAGCGETIEEAKEEALRAMQDMRRFDSDELKAIEAAPMEIAESVDGVVWAALRSRFW